MTAVWASHHEELCRAGIVAPHVHTYCRQVQRQLQRNESARFYHHRTRKCIPASITVSAT